MQHTEQQKCEIKEEYAVRRRRQFIAMIPLVAACVTLVLAREPGTQTILGFPADVVGPVILVLAVAALIFSLVNWRCPACSKYLGRNMWTRHCHNCGVELAT